MNRARSADDILDDSCHVDIDVTSPPPKPPLDLSSIIPAKLLAVHRFGHHRDVSLRHLSITCTSTTAVSASFSCYPHMPIGKVWIYRLLFVIFFVCLY